MCRARQFKLLAGVRSQGLIGYGILSSSLPSNVTRGRVAELADALDLGSSVAIRGGSSPLSPTTLEMPPERAVFFSVAPMSWNCFKIFRNKIQQLKVLSDCYQS